jgi:hypothetical protein
MHKQKKAGRWPGLRFPVDDGCQFEEFELEFEDEFELEFDEELELELDEEFEFEFELLFELELDSPRRFWPLRSFFIFKAVVTNLVSASFAAVSIAVPALTAAKAGMTNDPAATTVAASKVVSFLI